MDGHFIPIACTCFKTIRDEEARDIKNDLEMFSFFDLVYIMCYIIEIIIMG